MQILNIAGYQFCTLENLEEWRSHFQEKCSSLQLKGTILLSNEGINISLAGETTQVNLFLSDLKKFTVFNELKFHQTFSESIPFRHLRIKLRKEIITFGQAGIEVAKMRAPSITPEEFKKWLDENREITVLDTRNDYEVRFGTFKNALNLKIKDFGEFPSVVNQLDSDKPVVMFCTGGIRCEKAAIYLLNNGHQNVYQLDGGILGYFTQVGGDHFEGECFIFDERIAVDTNLKKTGTTQCIVCQGPILQNSDCKFCQK